MRRLLHVMPWSKRLLDLSILGEALVDGKLPKRDTSATAPPTQLSSAVVAAGIRSDVPHTSKIYSREKYAPVLTTCNGEVTVTADAADQVLASVHLLVSSHSSSRRQRCTTLQSGLRMRLLLHLHKRMSLLIAKTNVIVMPAARPLK